MICPLHLCIKVLNNFEPKITNYNSFNPSRALNISWSTNVIWLSFCVTNIISQLTITHTIYSENKLTPGFTEWKGNFNLEQIIRQNIF